LLRNIDPEQLQSVLSKWLLSTYPDIAKGKSYAIDGKAMRGTDSDPSKQVSVLNVLANDVGIVIGQFPTKKGSGEKKTARTFAEKSTDLADKCIVGDAMLTDRKVIEVLEKKRLNTYSLSKRISRALNLR
jgi:hypothetical protein